MIRSFFLSTVLLLSFYTTAVAEEGGGTASSSSTQSQNTQPQSILPQNTQTQSVEGSTSRRMLLSTQEQEAPREVDFMGEFVSMMTTLAVVVLLLALIGWALKRVMKGRMLQMNQCSEVKVLERRNLAPKAAVYLLEIRGKCFVIGETPAGLHTLGEVDSFDDPDEEESGGGRESPLGALMGRK